MKHRAQLSHRETGSEAASSSESSPHYSLPYPETSGQTTEATSEFEESAFSETASSSHPRYVAVGLSEDELEGSSPRLQPNATMSARWKFARARRRRHAEARRQQQLLEALQDDPGSNDPWAQAANLYRSSFSRDWAQPVQDSQMPRQRSTDRMKHQQAVEALHDDLHHDPAAHARQQVVRAAVQPSDAQLALCCLYANRYSSDKTGPCPASERTAVPSMVQCHKFNSAICWDSLKPKALMPDLQGSDVKKSRKSSSMELAPQGSLAPHSCLRTPGTC